MKWMIIGFIACVFSFQAIAEERQMSSEELNGKNIFEGRQRLENGGPSCVSCHNVGNKNVMMGGLYAKDLTDVYERLGEGISGWLMAPPFPAMAISYENNPLTEVERNDLQAFFKYAHEVHDGNEINPDKSTMLIGGFGGLFVILIMIALVWSNRKKKMVKREIFDRQSKAWDAKF